MNDRSFTGKTTVTEDKKMRGLKLVGLIEEAHGHRGAVKVKPVNGTGEKILDIKSVCLVDRQGGRIFREVYEVRKYRRGWRNLRCV